MDFKTNTFGIESDIVFFNNFQLPINLEYVKPPYSRDKIYISSIYWSRVLI